MATNSPVAIISKNDHSNGKHGINTVDNRKDAGEPHMKVAASVRSRRDPAQATCGSPFHPRQQDRIDSIGSATSAINERCRLGDQSRSIIGRSVRSARCNS
jgi:hypothetical protein